MDAVSWRRQVTGHYGGDNAIRRHAANGQESSRLPPTQTLHQVARSDHDHEQDVTRRQDKKATSLRRMRKQKGGWSVSGAGYIMVCCALPLSDSFPRLAIRRGKGFLLCSPPPGCSHRISRVSVSRGTGLSFQDGRVGPLLDSRHLEAVSEFAPAQSSLDGD